MSDRSAREILKKVWPGVMGEEPELPELQAAQAVTRGESGYGSTWKGACEGSNNWGAVQAGPPPCGTNCLYTDTHPNDDGTSTRYDICFKTYATPEEGAAHMLRILFLRDRAKKAGVLKAAKSGDLKAFSTAMYDSGYYESFGPTREARIAYHTKGLRYNAKIIAQNLDEPFVDELPKPLGGRRKTSTSGRKAAAVVLGAVGVGLLLAARK